MGYDIAPDARPLLARRLLSSSPVSFGRCIRKTGLEQKRLGGGPEPGNVDPPDSYGAGHADPGETDDSNQASPYRHPAAVRFIPTRVTPLGIVVAMGRVVRRPDPTVPSQLDPPPSQPASPQTRVFLCADC